MSKNPINDIGLAIFAVGRFIDFCINEGQTEEMQRPFMEAYETLCATFEGRPRLDLRALPFPKASAQPVSPGVPPSPAKWLSWTEKHGKLQRRVRELRTPPSTDDRYVQAAAERFALALQLPVSEEYEN